MNSTIAYGSIATYTDLWFPLLVVTIILIVGVLAVILSSVSRYKAFRGIFGFLAKCLSYFGKGLACLAIFGSAYIGVLILGQGSASGQIDLWSIAFWGAVAIGGFFGITGLGYLFDRFFIKRIRSFNKKLKKGVKP